VKLQANPEIQREEVAPDTSGKPRGWWRLVVFGRFNEVDRALADGEEDGLIKVHVKAGTDRIVGATIVARHAGEMISEITLAMVGGLGLRTISAVIHPYPTQAEAIKQVADAWSRQRLTPFVKKVLSWITTRQR